MDRVEVSANRRKKARFDPLRREQWIKRQPVTALGQRIVSATVEELAAKGCARLSVASPNLPYTSESLVPFWSKL